MCFWRSTMTGEINWATFHWNYLMEHGTKLAALCTGKLPVCYAIVVQFKKKSILRHLWAEWNLFRSAARILVNVPHPRVLRLNTLGRGMLVVLLTKSQIKTKKNKSHYYPSARPYHLWELMVWWASVQPTNGWCVWVKLIEMHILHKIVQFAKQLFIACKIISLNIGSNWEKHK